MSGIPDSLLAAIFYATGTKLYWKFCDPLKKAIDNTIVYFSKERGIELDRNRFEALLRGDIGEEELNKFKSGEKFIDGQKLALQFAIFGGIYHDDENQILTISNEIFSYFKSAFTDELLSNSYNSIQNLNHILEIHFKISQTEHDNIRKDILHFQGFLERKESIRTKYADYKIVDLNFWEKIRKESDKDYLHLFYTNTDASPIRLMDVVANEYYVINEKIDNQFLSILEQGLKNHYALIKIISRGGEGKSTFLFHLAKKYCRDYNVIILENINNDILIDIENQLPNNVSPRPFLFLLDNPSLFEEELIQSTQKLISGFRKYGFVLVIAEREFRYKNFEGIAEFENNFNQIYEINYVAHDLREGIFDKLFSLFQTIYDVPEYLKEDAKRIYFHDKRMSLSESTFAVIKEIVKRTGIKFIFDWKDWEKFTKEKAPELNELYLIVATFFQFGFGLPIDFCLKFFESVNRRTIIKIIGTSYNLPIYIRRNSLFLRHETIASWYLDDSHKNKEMSLNLFEEFLNKIDTEYDRDLLIWLYKHNEFQKSFLSEILDDERKINLFSSYIIRNNTELKSRTELRKLFQKQNRWNEAQDVLLDLLSIDPKNLHARTELAKIYQHQDKYDKAEKILMECLEINKNDLNSRTELAKIYQHQDKYDKAEKELRKCIDVNPTDLNSRTELSKVYQGMGKFKEAKSELINLLNLDPKSLYARTELAKIYQRLRQYNTAEKYLIKCIEIKPDDLNSRTELAKIYQHQDKYDKAEKILMESLSIDEKQLHPRTELAKIYQHQGKYDKAEKILMDLISIDKNNLQARTELAKIYQHQGKYDKAEKILMESLSIDEKQLHPRTELAKIYQHQGKYDKAEKALTEILKFDPCNCYSMAELIRVYEKKQSPEKCFQIFDTFLEKCRLEKKRRREPQAMFNNIFKLCSKYRRSDKAKQYYKKYSHILDDRNLALFRRCFG